MKSLRTLLPFVLVAALVLAACTGSHQSYERVLDEAERLMAARPDSSLILLNRYKDEKGQWPLKERMRFDLLRTNAMNKSDSVFTSDSIAKEVSDYYTHHGTPNERMLAHYLLGRAYSDMGEAPLAAKCFLDAISLADTTGRDCDYRQLYTVYFQLSNEFYRQMLFREQLSAIDKAVYYANLANDSLTAVICYQYKSFAYDKLSCYDSVVYVTEQASEAFLRLGDVENSARTLAAGLRSLIKTGDLERAAAVINTYESMSGFFNENHDIVSGREIYYSMKGDYYLARHQPDSAEYYFRKELKDGKDLNNQSAAARGLSLVYEMKHNPDSVAFYSLRSYTLNDSVYSGMATEKVKQVQSLYNYDRSLMRSAALEKENMKIRLFLVLVLVFVFFVMLISFLFVRAYHQKRERAREGMMLWRERHAQLMQLHSELEMLKQSGEESLQFEIADKQGQIDHLHSRLKELEQKLHLRDLVQHENILLGSDLVNDLRHLNKQPSNEQWQELRKHVDKALPDFLPSLRNRYPLIRDEEMNICILLRLHIPLKQIAALSNISLQNLNVIRKRLMMKVYGIEGSAKDFDSKIQDLA